MADPAQAHAGAEAQAEAATAAPTAPVRRTALAHVTTGGTVVQDDNRPVRRRRSLPCGSLGPAAPAARPGRRPGPRPRHRADCQGRHVPLHGLCGAARCSSPEGRATRRPSPPWSSVAERLGWEVTVSVAAPRSSRDEQERDRALERCGNRSPATTRVATSTSRDGEVVRLDLTVAGQPGDHRT